MYLISNSVALAPTHGYFVLWCHLVNDLETQSRLVYFVARHKSISMKNKIPPNQNKTKQNKTKQKKKKQPQKYKTNKNKIKQSKIHLTNKNTKNKKQDKIGHWEFPIGWNSLTDSHTKTYKPNDSRMRKCWKILGLGKNQINIFFSMIFSNFLRSKETWEAWKMHWKMDDYACNVENWSKRRENDDMRSFI